MKIWLLSLLCLLAPLSGHAGQATVVETETGFIVELNGSEADRQSTIRQHQEREQALIQEEAEKARKRASSERRAKARAASEEGTEQAESPEVMEGAEPVAPLETSPPVDSDTGAPTEPVAPADPS